MEEVNSYTTMTTDYMKGIGWYKVFGRVMATGSVFVDRISVGSVFGCLVFRYIVGWCNIAQSR